MREPIVRRWNECVAHSLKTLAGVAELVDAADSKSGLSTNPQKIATNLKRRVFNGLGLWERRVMKSPKMV